MPQGSSAVRPTNGLYLLPLPIHCGCRVLLLHLITLDETYTFGRTPLDKRSARHRGLYLTTRNIHKR